MTCGGEMTLFFEVHSAALQWHIVIFGSGHVVQALAPILATLPCHVDIVDNRPDWLGKIHPAENLATHLVTAHTDALNLVTAGSFVLSITQGHTADRPILAGILAKHPEIPFIGVIGSASKRATLSRELQESGISSELIEKIPLPARNPSWRQFTATDSHLNCCPAPSGKAIARHPHGSPRG